MATTQASSDDQFSDFISSLPSRKGWRSPHCYQYQGFWYTPLQLQGIVGFQQRFQVSDSDLFLVTHPKSGTTWLKSLVYAIVNRTQYSDYHHHPLLSNSPHDLVPFAEQFYVPSSRLEVTDLPIPRVFTTHCPSVSLPKSVQQSSCQIVYLSRNPRDTFNSWWHFNNKLRAETSVGPPLSLEEALEMFCMGVSDYGPYWDHALGYWKGSSERPEKMLFLKYEEMKDDPVFHLKRLAKHIGYPFSPDETEEIMEILKLCSFENMSHLEVNKSGRTSLGYSTSIYFRLGRVGDWMNYLTAEMIEQLDSQSKKKFGDSGLTFSNGTIL